MWNWLKRELSLDKLWKYIQTRIETLHKKMLRGDGEFTASINSLLENIIVIYEKNIRKKEK